MTVFEGVGQSTQISTNINQNKKYKQLPNSPGKVRFFLVLRTYIPAQGSISVQILIRNDITGNVF